MCEGKTGLEENRCTGETAAMSQSPRTDSSSPFSLPQAGRSAGNAADWDVGVNSGRGADETFPHFELEAGLIRKGARLVAGVDEAGRGPLAGPVVAAAVILRQGAIPEGLNDSKRLTAKRREELYEEILASAVSVAWHSVGARRIDTINILQASLEAMAASVSRLASGVDAVLFDGRDVPVPCHAYGRAVIKGDATCLSISAASVVAKVVRDRIMVRADTSWPQYGFCGHKGYGSSMHIRAIAEHGPCPLHRMSFSPMKDIV